MKILFFLGSLILSSNVPAELEKSPTEFYSMSALMAKSVLIRVKVAKNARAACEKESHRLGLGGFEYPIDACSFWVNEDNGVVCTVVIPEQSNNSILGHEFRHCLQGHFH